MRQNPHPDPLPPVTLTSPLPQTRGRIFWRNVEPSLNHGGPAENSGRIKLGASSPLADPSSWSRRRKFSGQPGAHRAAYHAPLLYGVVGIFVRRRIPVRCLSAVPPRPWPEPIADEQRARNLLHGHFPD